MKCGSFQGFAAFSLKYFHLCHSGLIKYLITKIRKLADLLQGCCKAADGNSKSSFHQEKKTTVNKLDDNVYFKNVFKISEKK